MSEINILQNRDSHIWSLRVALFFTAIIAIFELAIIAGRDDTLTIQIPPDLSKGALIKPGEFQPAHAYIFAVHMWRALNDWPVSGRNDYKSSIEVNECYVTPKFAAWLVDNYAQKLRDGELERRRSVSLVDAFNDEIVKALGANTYAVYLTTHINEQIDKETIKDTKILYPLRVVADNRKCNRMGMSLDGFYEEPKRVE